MNEAETYLAPGTNCILKHAWQIELINRFHPQHDGRFIIKIERNLYEVEVIGNWANVLPFETYVRIKNRFKRQLEAGFKYRLDFV